MKCCVQKELSKTLYKEVSRLCAFKIGDYENVATYYEIEGCWKPSGNSNPVTGAKNIINYGKEYKLEFRCEESKRCYSRD